MAKRFTDTRKWDEAWYRKLSPRLKCAWDFLGDRCDHAGVWDIDIDSMGFHVGESVTLNEILDTFKVKPLDGNKLQIEGFIEFQYGVAPADLNPANRVHRSVLQRLERLAPSKPLISPLDGAKDKDKDKDKDKEKDKEALEQKQLHIRTLSQIWMESLYAMGHARSLTSHEEQLIFYALKKDTPGMISAALFGARFEPKVKDFDPARAPDISRILGDPKIAIKTSQLAKFIGYAATRPPEPTNNTMADLEKL